MTSFAFLCEIGMNLLERTQVMANRTQIDLIARK